MDGFTWIIEDRLAASPMPQGKDWEWLSAKAGIQAVLSLAPVGGKDIGLLGKFKHLTLPLPDNIPPTVQDVRTYRSNLPKALVWLSHHLEEGKPTLVHCTAGKDRTGLVLAYFLSRYWEREHEITLDAEATIARLRRILPKALSAAGYEDAARKVI